MKPLSQYITEDRIRSVKGSVKVHPVPTYFPKTNAELCTLVEKLVKERGNDADLNDIDVSGVSDFGGVFSSPKTKNFNGDISFWDTSHATNMAYMFYYSKFNGDISQWDVRNVDMLEFMFYNSDFNGNISNWRIKDDADLSYMFARSNFAGNIEKWNITPKTYTKDMFIGNEKNAPSWYKR